MANHGGRRALRLAASGLALAAACLLAAGSVVLAADQAVAISGFSFSPKSVTVSVGDSVTWTNSDAQAHTATADDGSFDTENIANGASKSVTFANAGTFAYHCEIHPTMTGTVVVQAAAGGGGGAATPRPTTPATDARPVAADRQDLGSIAAILILVTAGAVGFGVGARLTRLGGHA